MFSRFFSAASLRAAQLWLRAFCFSSTCSELGCSTCNSCRASWFTTATRDALPFISCSKPSKRCRITSVSSASLVSTMLSSILSFSWIHWCTPSASLNSLCSERASRRRCFRSRARSSRSL
uniref:Secreted protein n=1 Tax=Ixodes ricinus TaxID=34613 RepID=A0A6B0UNN0_IXORI